jgi:hypothetical protein
MTFPRLLGLLLAIAAGTTSTFNGAEKDAAAAFEFREVKYFHRWSKNEQHEFTPAKQEDLEHWSDMVTINGYPDVDDGDELAESANAVLGNYEKAGAKVLRTNSVPQTEQRPAEYFIAALFTRADFAETAFARFKIVDGKGHSFVYSHRLYGDKAGDEMKTWLSANGAEVEKALMDWSLSPGQLQKGDE